MCSARVRDVGLAVGSGAGSSIPVYVKARLRAKLDRIEEITRNRDSIVQGNLQFLDLAVLRDKLGDRWPIIRVRLYERIDQELECLLTESDEYLRTTDDFYFIVFGDRDRESIIHQLGNIAEKVAGILEDEGVNTLDVLAVGARKRSSEEVLGSFAAMKGLFDGESAAEASRIEQLNSSAGSSTSIGRMCGIRYQPILTTSRESVLGYHVRVSNRTGEKEVRYGAFASGQASTTAARHAIDIWAAATAVQQCVHLHEENQIFYFVLPVSYSTIADRRKLAELKALFARHEAVLKRTMVLELAEMPQDMPFPPLKKLLEQLRPFCSRIAINCGRGETIGFHTFRRAGARVVTLSMHALVNDTPAKAQALVQMANDNAVAEGLELFLYHADSAETFNTAVTNRISQVSGPVIGRRRLSPSHVSQMSVASVRERLR